VGAAVGDQAPLCAVPVLHGAGNSVFFDALGNTAATSQLAQIVQAVAVTRGGAATLAEVAQVDVPVAVASGPAASSPGEQAEEVTLKGCIVTA
jgi:hypothetical protein